jgi:hypothetical protein
MRVMSLPVGNDLLELKINMWIGKEEVFWNGVSVSSKTHFLGTEHGFNVESADGAGVDVYRVVTSYGWMGYQYDVFCNEKCLLGSSRTSIHQVAPNQEPVMRRRRRPAAEVHGRRAERELSLEELEDGLV